MSHVYSLQGGIVRPESVTVLLLVEDPKTTFPEVFSASSVEQAREVALVIASDKGLRSWIVPVKSVEKIAPTSPLEASK